MSRATFSITRPTQSAYGWAWELRAKLPGQARPIVQHYATKAEAAAKAAKLLREAAS